VPRFAEGRDANFDVWKWGIDELDGNRLTSDVQNFSGQLQNRQGVLGISDVKVFADGRRTSKHFNDGVAEIFDVTPRANLRTVSMNFNGISH
jgi:hypothetical protein